MPLKSGKPLEPRPGQNPERPAQNKPRPTPKRKWPVGEAVTIRIVTGNQALPEQRPEHCENSNG